MADESNGESTFEFVDKKEELTVTAEVAKTESASSLSSSASLLTPQSFGSGNLLSNVAPPSALPSFVSKETRPESKPKPKPLPEPYDEIVECPEEIEPMGPLGGGLFTWVRETVANSGVLSKVAEKAKSSVNSMITTLDPQMREFIYSGGDVEVVVASDKDVKVSPVRQAFQTVFGKATVTGLAAEAETAAQPVGFAAAAKAAEERIRRVRETLPRQVPVVAVENFLLEVDDDKWYDLGVIVLSDFKNNINLRTFTQMTPVPSQIVAAAKRATQPDYPHVTSGLAVTVGSLMAADLQVSHTEWHYALTGVSRRSMILLAAQSLAGIYKNALNPL